LSKEDRVDIVVRGRSTEIPERFRVHVEDKLGKVAKLDPKVMRIDVEVAEERNRRLSSLRSRIELTCRSRGPVIRAEAAADDPYAALDLAFCKLENRLRRAADRRRVHHGSRTPESVAAATARLDEMLAAPDWEPDHRQETANGDSAVVAEDGPFVVREKVHDAEPMTLDQALHEMELVGHDFFLFVDRDTRAPSVVYRRKAYDYGVLRLRTASVAATL
jgi:ribosomal subunit interface protein